MPVRFAKPGDFDQVAAIAREIYANPEMSVVFNWPENSVRDELLQSTSLVFETEEGVQSFICFRDLPDVFDIMLLATASGFQKRQLQSRLIEFLQGLAAKQRKAVLLEVHAENLPAQNLYQKLGFKVINRRPHYYSDGAAALVMGWNKAGC